MERCLRSIIKVCPVPIFVIMLVLFFGGQSGMCQETVFEDFESGPGGFWEDGYFSVSDGRFYFQGDGSGGGYFTLWSGGSDPSSWRFIEPDNSNYFENFNVSADVFWEGGSEYSDYGLILCTHKNSEGTADYVIFEIDRTGGLVIDKRKNAIYEELVDRKSSLINTTSGSANRLSVIKNGDVFSFYINGVRVERRIIEGMTGGGIGVVASSMLDAAFDNFFITSPDDPGWVPKQGQRNMTVHGEAFIEGLKIESPGYIVGAFGPGGYSDCRGKAAITESDGQWQYRVSVASDAEGEEITFRIWSGSDYQFYSVKDTLVFKTGSDIEKTLNMPLLESVSPRFGLAGQDLEVVLTGSGFDQNTRVAVYPDILNKSRMIGSVILPGEVLDVAVVGTTAYTACGYEGLQIINVSNSDSPVIVGSLKTGGIAGSIAVSGQTAYLSNREGGLQIIDISSPDHPEIIGNLYLPGNSWDIAVSGETICVADGEKGLQVADISDPEHPAIIANVEIGDARCVAVSGTMAYAADDQGTLYAIDIRLPERPVLKGSLDTPGNSWDIAVSSETAYLAGGFAGLHLIDISNPETPSLISTLETPGESKSVILSGNTAYIADGDAGLQIIDISTPQNAAIIETVNTPRNACGLAYSGNIVYMADGYGGLQVIEARNEDPVNEYPIMVNTPGSARSVATVGEIAYIACGSDGFGGLEIVDISDPEHPLIVGILNTPGSAQDISVVGETAYLADGDEGLQIIDVSNPGNPVIIGSADTSDDARGVAVAGKTAYVTDWYGFYVIDVSKPENPVIVSSLDTLDGPGNMAVSGNTVYVEDWDGLHVIDVSSPENPVIIGFVDVSARDIAVVGQTLVYVTAGSGLQIIDVSNPKVPNIINSLNIPDYYAASIAVSGNMAYIGAYESACWWPGTCTQFGLFVVLDVSDPKNPLIIGSINTPGSSFSDISVAGGTVCMAEGSEGLAVIHPVPAVIETGALRVESETRISFTLPALENMGPYALTVYNQGEQYEVPKAVSIVFPKGDLTGDGLVSLADIVVALKVLSGNAVSAGYDYVSAGFDVNGDNRIGMAEAVYILGELAIGN